MMKLCATLKRKCSNKFLFDVFLCCGFQYSTPYWLYSAGWRITPRFSRAANSIQIKIYLRCMSLYQDLNTQLKEAMKAGDVLKRDTVRLIQSAVKNSAIDKRQEVALLSDEEVMEVIKRLVKQRKDSIEQYRAGGREDLAEKEAAELAILEAYLPAEMSDEELRDLITETLAESGITAPAQMGQAMGLAMKKVSGRASGDRVRAFVESALKGNE